MRFLALGDSYTSDVRADDFQFGQLWIAGSSWGAPEKLPWLAFDLASARVTHAHGAIALKDVSDAGWPH